MKAEKYMTSEVVVISKDASVQTARNLMLSHGISRLVVVEGEKPIGIVTKKDIARGLAQPRAPWQRRPIDKIAVSRVMSTDLKTVTPETELKDVAKIMLENGISSTPVVSEGKLVGIITATDLIKAFAENLEGVYKNKDLMSREVITANRYHSLYHLLKLMEEHNISRVIIAEGKKPVGIVTVTDLSFLELEDPERGLKTKEYMFVRKPARDKRASYRYITRGLLTAEDVMREELITTTEEEDCSNSARLMLKHGISSLPVVNEDELVGIITKKDIIKGIAGR